MRLRGTRMSPSPRQFKLEQGCSPSPGSDPQPVSVPGWGSRYRHARDAKAPRQPRSTTPEEKAWVSEVMYLSPTSSLADEVKHRTIVRVHLTKKQETESQWTQGLIPVSTLALLDTGCQCFLGYLGYFISLLVTGGTTSCRCAHFLS